MSPEDFGAALNRWCEEAPEDAKAQYNKAADRMYVCFHAGRLSPNSRDATKLSFDGLNQIKTLPSEIVELKTLQELDLSGCRMLENLPESTARLPHTCTIQMGELNFPEKPSLDQPMKLRRKSDGLTDAVLQESSCSRDAESENDYRLVPSRLQEKIDLIDLNDEVFSSNNDFFEYAKEVVTGILKGWQAGFKTAKLERLHLPLIAEMENKRNPGLNLHVFDDAQKFYEMVAEKQSRGKLYSFRALYSPSSGMSNHYAALDIKIDPRKPISIIFYESTLVHLVDIFADFIKENIENSRVHIVNNTIQHSEWDCTTFSLNNALKSYKTYEVFANKIHQKMHYSPTVDRLPAVFLKHAHSRSSIKAHALTIVNKERMGSDVETLEQRVEAFRANRRGDCYSTSIEGFRLQEIKRLADYLKDKATLLIANKSSLQNS
ncbi:MAG: YopJ family acetyltransferase [Burkholderiaceae bacterium]